MSTAGALVTFSMTWWLFFFMALPFGIKPDEDGVVGSDPGAPARPRLLIKAVVSTVLAVLATLGVAWLIGSGLIDIRPTGPI